MAGTRRGHEGTSTGKREHSRRAGGWLGILRQALALHLARAARRVHDRRAKERPAESGRLGGAVAAPPRVPDRSAARERARAASPDGDRAEARAQPAERGAETPPGAWETAKLVFREFGKDNGTLMAAAVAFYLFLSLVPIALLAVSVLGFFLSGEQAQARVLEALNQFVATGEGRRMVRGAVDAVVDARGAIGGAGLLGLLFTATGGFAVLETAINVTWGAPNRGFVRNKLFAVGMMLAIGALFLLSFGLTVAAATIADWARFVPGLGAAAGRWLLQALGLLLPVLISGGMFAVIYRYFPNLPSRWKPALIAGFLTAVLWEAFKIGYAYYTRQFANLGATYGTLGGLVGLVMWMYYSAAIVLLGGELTWVLNGRPGGERKPASRDE